MYFVYLLHCADNTFYTGITTDVCRRLEQHNHSPLGAKYTKTRRPVLLAYLETQSDRSAALKRELEIKSMTKNQKQILCDNQCVLK